MNPTTAWKKMADKGTTLLRTCLKNRRRRKEALNCDRNGLQKPRDLSLLTSAVTAEVGVFKPALNLGNMAVIVADYFTARFLQSLFQGMIRLHGMMQLELPWQMSGSIVMRFSSSLLAGTGLTGLSRIKSHFQPAHRPPWIRTARVKAGSRCFKGFTTDKDLQPRSLSFKVAAAHE